MSVTARLSRLKDQAQGVARTTIRVATPIATTAVEKVRSRWQRPGPAPVRTQTPGSGAPATERRTGPTPATVAHNIAPHPPTPAAPARPRPPASPSAKLPPRRRTDDD